MPTGRKELHLTGEAFELEGVSTGIENEEYSLFPNFTDAANSRRNQEFACVFLKPVGKRLPVGQVEDDAEVPGTHPKTPQ